MSRISIVQQEYRICSKCGESGHNREDCQTILDENYYKIGFITKCSRCDQPGHNRNNRVKCSLFEEYPDKKYQDIREIQERSDFIQNNLNQIELNNIKLLLIQIETYSVEMMNLIIHRNQEIIHLDKLMDILHNVIIFKNIINEMSNDLTTISTVTLSYIKEVLNEYQNDIMQILITFNNQSLWSLYALISRHQEYYVYFTEWIKNAFSIKRTQNNNIKIITIQNVNLDQMYECSICYENNSIEKSTITDCNHSFCIECMISYCKSRQTSNNVPCPMCRHDIKELNIV